MSVQISVNNSTVPFIRSGQTFTKESETLLQDAARSTPLATFTLMGKVPVSLPTTGTADGGNTGDGTVTSVALAAGVIPRGGIWELECIAAVANGGTFKLTDPGGNIIRNDLVMTAGAGAATTFYIPEAGMTFIITDGATDFIVGDKFTIEATVVGKWAAFDPDAVNGANIPKGIYQGYEIAAATIVAGDVLDLPMLVGGACTIDGNQLTIEGGATKDTVLSSGKTIEETLFEIGIFIEDTVDIDEFENA
jgi:hypothetical protein